MKKHLDFVKNHANFKKIEKIIGRSLSVSHTDLPHYMQQLEDTGAIAIRSKATPHSPHLYMLCNFITKPGCCGIVTLTGIAISGPIRKKGLGKLSHELWLDLASQAGYGYVEATCLNTNEVQIHIFESFGWKRTGEFINPRTNNTVICWGRQLG